MTDVLNKLQQLEIIYNEANAPILHHFNPGLPEEEIIKWFKNNDIFPHPDLITLYTWHNGVKSIYGLKSSFIDLFPGGCFPNLSEMLALRDLFLSFDYFEVENRHEYIPILSGGEDDMYLLKSSTGQIYYSSPRIQIYCEPEYSSLSSMLDYILDCFKQGLLRMGMTEGLQISEKYWEIRSV